MGNGLQELKEKLKDMVTQAKERFHSITLSNFLKSSPQKFWRYFSENKELIEQIVVDDTDPLSIAGHFNAYFQSVF